MPDIFFSIFVFLFGLILGSFLNCVIYRLAPHQNFGGGLGGRSFCPHCKHTLSWQDLIPVFSFIFLKGKCRYCKKPISWQYPLIELVTGILFILVLYHTAYNIPYTIYELIIACFLIIIFVYDLKHYIIPDSVIYPAIAIALIFPEGKPLVSYGAGNFQLLILSAFGAALFFLLIVLITRGKGMGVGDIKLAFFMGLFLSWPNISVALFSAFFIGAIIGIGLIISDRKTLKSEVPFGPFLVAGTFLALFFGGRLIDWYLGLFLLK